MSTTEPSFYHPHPQGALQYDPRKVAALVAKGTALVTRKVDGIRASFQVSPQGTLAVVSRSGKLIPALQELAKDWATQERLMLEFPEGVELDCEVTVIGQSFQTGCGMLRRKVALPADVLVIHPISVHFFNSKNTLSPYGQMQSRAVTLGERLARILGCLCQDQYIGFPRNMLDLETWYEQTRADNYEGLMIHDAAGSYRAGKVSGWWKMKPEEEHDGVVVGWLPGTGKYEGMMGALMVRLETDITVKVGTGFSDEDRKRPADYWMGRYCQLTAMEVTPDGSLRHPAWDRFRDLEDSKGVKS